MCKFSLLCPYIYDGASLAAFPDSLNGNLASFHTLYSDDKSLRVCSHGTDSCVNYKLLATAPSVGGRISSVKLSHATSVPTVTISI